MADDDVRLTLLADFRLAQTTTDPQSAVAGAGVAVLDRHGVVCVGAGRELVCVEAAALEAAAWARYDDSKKSGGSKRREGAAPPSLTRAELAGPCTCCAASSDAAVVAAASSNEIEVFAVERGPSLRRVRTTPYASVTALAVSGDGAWVAASTSTKTTVFKVDGGGDMELDGSHAAFRGSKLAVASSEGVVTYALTNDVWREEGRVGADADALGDDEARSPHFVRWLDDARILLGFRHTEDALARAIVVDVSSKTVTTYAADLGDTVVAFFDREAPGSPHAFFAASSRSGLCLVACNLSRDVGVVREDPEQPGAYYLHEAYDEAALVCQTPSQSMDGDERETLVAGLGVLATGVTRAAPPAGRRAAANRRGPSRRGQRAQRASQPKPSLRTIRFSSWCSR